MIRIVPFQVEHIRLIGPPIHDIAGIDAMKTNMDGWAALLKNCGPAFSAVLEDGRIIGSAGLIRFQPWRATAWAYIGALALDHPFLVHRKVLRGLNMLMLENGIKRVEAEVQAGDGKAIEWIRRLGFKHEGDMPGCGPNGEVYSRYGKVVT